MITIKEEKINFKYRTELYNIAFGPRDMYKGGSGFWLSAFAKISEDGSKIRFVVKENSSGGSYQYATVDSKEKLEKLIKNFDYSGNEKKLSESDIEINTEELYNEINNILDKIKNN